MEPRARFGRGPTRGVRGSRTGSGRASWGFLAEVSVGVRKRARVRSCSANSISGRAGSCESGESEGARGRSGWHRRIQSMLRKIAIALIAVAIAWFGGRALVHALASDETKIRWKLEDACEGFSNARMSPILDFLAHEFVDETSGYHRDDVRAAVAGAF